MLWYLPWSENIKKRACRYLLQRYLGNFLEEKLTLDQLSVDLYNGTGTVCDVSIDCEALNELGDSQNWPLEIVDGHMKEITVTIPWSTLLKDDSIVEVNGLSVTVQPKVRAEPVSSMLESMWSSMSSSMQLAAECLREEDGPQEAHPVEGIEMFAHAIDSILSRVKVRFVNTKIRIEHVPKDGMRGIALEIHIKNIDYCDEAGSEPAPDVTDPEKPKTYIVATYTNKKIKFNGVTLYTDEFPSKLRTMARSLIMEKSTSSQIPSEQIPLDQSDINYQSTLSDVFYETRSVISTIESDPIKELLGDQERSVSREVSPEERANQPDPILFAKITGNQELSLKLKHSDEVEGPKVEVRMLFGSLIVFFSPRQLHTIIELVDALNQPQIEDTSNIPLRPSGNIQCKPMKHADFQLIEAQLLGNLERENTRQPAPMYGWSGPNYEDSDAENDKFHPMTTGNQMSDSYSSSVSSMSTSVTSSVYIPSSQPRLRRNKKVPHIDGDPTAEVSHISFRIAAVSCVLIHKDILHEASIGSDCISPLSANEMQQTAILFFENYERLTVADGGKRDLDTLNNVFDRATMKNHLRLLSTEISLDGSEKVTSDGSQTVCEASINHLLVRECLYQDQCDLPEAFDIITFENKNNDDDTSSKKSSSTSKPNVKVNFKQTSKFVRISGEKKLFYPTTDIVVKWSPCTVEVDLTLVDRMSATWTASSSAAASQNQLNFTLHCPELTTLLRFPVVDLRPAVSREQRVVRADFLTVRMSAALLTVQQAASLRPLPLTLTINTTQMDLFYHENETLPPTSIARAVMDDSIQGNILNRGTATGTLPTISLTFKPEKQSKGPFDEEHVFEPAVNPMTTSIYLMNNLHNSQPSPFSAKKTAHQSITKHENSNQPGQEEEIIVPGTEEEMSDFMSSSVEHSSIHLDFNLPTLSLQLESKQLYEILYNRISSDLLLWEPMSRHQFEISPHIAGDIYPAFGICKGGGYDSDSDSTTSEEDNVYYSTYESKTKKTHGTSKLATETKETHNFCLTFKVSQGLLTMYAPVRDGNKRVVPGQMGELVLEAHNLTMCSVSGLNGAPKTALMCLRANTTTLYHDSMLTIPTEKPGLRLYGTTLPMYLKKTIYQSGKGVIIKDNTVKKDMFSMALKVEPNSETPNLKTICIALGLEQASLRHRGSEGITWLTQIMDMMDVVEYPVPGAAPAHVLSELHVHLWDCALDYRPLYLPIRSVVTLGNFTVSSNLIPETNTSCLRFLAQECSLFLSHVNVKPNAPIPQDDDKAPDLNKDYVCVIDVGLFELSLRMEEKTSSSGSPAVDLSVSNNMVQVYTCWDSASALCRLLTYLAADEDNRRDAGETSGCSDHLGGALVGLEDGPVEEIRELSPSEIQQVNDLMAEALKESPNTTQEDELNSSTEKEGVEIFFFPDESNAKKQTDVLIPDLTDETVPTDIDDKVDYDHFQYNIEEAQEAKPVNAQVVKDLGDPTSSPKSSPRKVTDIKARRLHAPESEYCVVASEGCAAAPALRWLRAAPLLDDHFRVPAARAHVLSAPRTFPAPLLRYTLCEMSLTWHIFGGTDFGAPGSTPPHKTVTIDTQDRNSDAVKGSKEYDMYSRARYSEGVVRWSAPPRAAGAPHVAPPRPPRPPPRRAPPHRDTNTCVKLCLTKVKFQHEVYPSSGIHASRQTLAISNIEVLDRLSCSDINKLLSQYTLKDEPERKNTHMLVVKAVHLRPEAALPAQECCLKVSLLPLRFNLDQDTLAFLVGFFTKLGTDDAEEDGEGVSSSGAESRQATPTHRPPVMSVGRRATPTQLPTNTAATEWSEPLLETYEAERLVSENLIQLEEEFQRLAPDQPAQPAPPHHGPQPDHEPDHEPAYFRRVVFSPEVPIRLDYVGKRVDLSAGPVAGLLMGLGQLNCSELTLKRLDYKLGLLGVQKLVQWALHEWLSDIKRHQLPGLLSGIGPMHSLLQLMSGVRDLVALPWQQWRRDGRVVAGLRRGAASFSARAALAAIDLTSHVLLAIHAACALVAPSPRGGRPRRAPASLRAGVAAACGTLAAGWAGVAAAARRERGVGVLRVLPGAALAPLALAAAGAADVLGGVRAHLAPGAARDHRDKWRRPADPSSE